MKRTDPLRASELAINDCVYWLGPPSVYSKERPEIIKITDIVTSVNDPEIDFYVWEVKNRDIDISNEDIRPIPLTHHRLIKNGFIEDDIMYFDNGRIRRYYKIDVKDCSNLHLTECNTGYYITGVPIEFIKPVKYVHQLQNLLRCCGAFELANSFKP